MQRCADREAERRAALAVAEKLLVLAEGLADGSVTLRSLEWQDGLSAVRDGVTGTPIRQYRNGEDSLTIEYTDKRVFGL